MCPACITTVALIVAGATSTGGLTMLVGNHCSTKARFVSQKRGLSVSDGPFAESKEAIGGFFLLEVGSLDEAAEIAKDFPGLEYGATVEVRPVAPECMVGDARLRASA